MAFTLTARLKILPPSNIGKIVADINRQLKGVNANVNINIPSNATRQLSTANTQMKQLATSTKKAEGYVESLGKSAAISVRRYAGFTLFASTFYTLTKAISSSVSEAIEFQRELVRVRQVSGVALKDLQNLTDEVTKLSTTFGVSSKKLLNRNY
jgi:hypothetical protein